MRKFKLLLIVSSFGLCLTHANAGSITGNQFLGLSVEERGWYFLGTLDAIKETKDAFFATSNLQAADFDRFWEACISGRPLRQHLAIFDSWMQKNPTRWHEPAITLIIQAQRQSCETVQTEAKKNTRD